MDIATKFPPLYQCEKCDAAVKVKLQGVGIEPIIKRSCQCPTDTPILARRKVTLRGKGALNANFIKRQSIKITLTLRQFLSALTGRSI